MRLMFARCRIKQGQGRVSAEELGWSLRSSGGEATVFLGKRVLQVVVSVGNRLALAASAVFHLVVAQLIYVCKGWSATGVLPEVWETSCGWRML